MVLNNQKAEQILGWTPSIEIDAGIVDTVSNFVNQSTKQS